MPRRPSVSLLPSARTHTLTPTEHTHIHTDMHTASPPLPYTHLSEVYAAVIIKARVRL